MSAAGTARNVPLRATALGCLTATRLLAEVVQQFAGLDFETARESQDRGQAGLTSATFYSADRRWMNVRGSREVVLGDRPLGANFTHSTSEGDARCAGV